MPQKIGCVADYLSAVRDLCVRWDSFRTTITPWFRGQAKSTWQLLPSLYRCDIDPQLERELVRDFQLRSTAYLNRPPENYVGWLFVMQHYGLPTRLLDWTESSLAALYFAIYNRSHSDDDAAVWVMNPWSLNEITTAGRLKSVPTLDDTILSEYLLDIPSIQREPKATFPLALRPLRADPRIAAQKGMFTIHGAERVALQDYISRSRRRGYEIPLETIIIDGTKATEILRELYVAGVTHSVFFPDLEALSRDIALRYRRDFMC